MFGENFGEVISSGDYNNDGLSDLAISAPRWYSFENGIFETDVGRVYIFYQKSFENSTLGSVDTGKDDVTLAIHMFREVDCHPK